MARDRAVAARSVAKRPNTGLKQIAGRASVRRNGNVEVIRKSDANPKWTTDVWQDLALASAYAKAGCRSNSRRENASGPCCRVTVRAALGYSRCEPMRERLPHSRTGSQKRGVISFWI